MEEKAEYKNIFELNGYDSRKDYLQAMSEKYAVPLEVVVDLARLLGESELFDGLISALEDAEGMFDYYDE
jgi:hypothetical protein